MFAKGGGSVASLSFPCRQGVSARCFADALPDLSPICPRKNCRSSIWIEHGPSLARTLSPCENRIRTRSGLVLRYVAVVGRAGCASFSRVQTVGLAKLRRYRLKVRTEPSQGSNPGSSPGIATIFFLMFLWDDLSAAMSFPAATLALI